MAARNIFQMYNLLNNLSVVVAVLCVGQVTMVRVQVSEGTLEGEVIQNEYGGSFYSFKGIPYAEPPVGELRFKAPQPLKPWEDVRSAKEFGPQCLQFNMFRKTGVVGNENCLYLNVYSPEVKPDKPLPVMVFIHGGAFVSGSGNDDFYGPEFLVRQDVVVVTINYRLEVLGFLCLDIEEVPGNAGMKDQVAALRWVKKNILNFGGDPDNVTIFGESAGGACVSFHLLSPMTKGLFKRAISQSGVSTCPWAQVYKPLDRAFMLGRKLGLDTKDARELYVFFKNQPAASLIQAHVPILLSEKAKTGFDIYFCVVDEKEFGQERYIYGGISDIISKDINEGVDVMIGFTSDEGLVNISSPDDLEKKLDLAKNYPEFFVPKPMTLSLPMDQQLQIGKEVRKYYFKDVEEWEALKNYYSDSMFIYDIVQFAKFCVSKKKNNSYLYKFSCKSERNILAHVLGSASIIGNTPVTCHADDLLYLFDAKMINTKVDMSSKTFELIDRVTKIWTNFAKYGNPTPDESLGVKWSPYTLEKQHYLDIGNELTLGSSPDSPQIQFWEQIYKK